MEKINIAELLKDCPKGMELDCYLFNGLEFDHIDTDNETYPIVCRAKDSTGEDYMHTFTKYGWYTSHYDYAKCVIFPKGKTTWEGFVPPCQFKDGDIVATDSGRWLGIIKNKYNSGYYTVHCAIDYTFNDIFYRCGEYRFSRLATEEEKEKLFKAIKESGYRWNPETKTLKKLIEPEFKVGDRITLKNHDDGKLIYKIIDVKDTYYVTDQGKLPFYYANPWKLVPNKFDINTLVPFESKVLVRNDEGQYWIPAFWGCKRSDGYTTTFGWCKYCIPFEGNEHLLETNNDCNEFYKTWK